MTLLKDYIKTVLENAPETGAVDVEVSLYRDGSVSDTETGNKVRFTIEKTQEIKK